MSNKIKGKFETGRKLKKKKPKFLKSSVLRFDFFKSGVMTAVLSATGINKVTTEQFPKSLMTRRRTGRRPVRTEAGTGSNAQDLTLQDLKRLAMYARETLSKDVSYRWNS